MALTDEEIVKRYLLRDETALEQTAAVYGERLRMLAFGIVQDCDTAEECENDTYLKAWSSIPPHEPYHYFFAFLARITRHLSLNCCRDQQRLKRKAYLCELSREMEECIPSPDDTACRLEEKELSYALNMFLASLSPQKRCVFLRRYWYGDSVATIALRFNMSQSRIKTMLFRIRQQLRVFLQKEGYVL